MSDEEEVADSEEEGMMGCLGFVAGSSEPNSPSKRKSHSQVKKMTAHSKSDITKATPGTVIRVISTQIFLYYFKVGRGLFFKTYPVPKTTHP